MIAPQRETYRGRDEENPNNRRARLAIEKAHREREKAFLVQNSSILKFSLIFFQKQSLDQPDLSFFRIVWFKKS